MLLLEYLPHQTSHNEHLFYEVLAITLTNWLNHTTFFQVRALTSFGLHFIIGNGFLGLGANLAQILGLKSQSASLQLIPVMQAEGQ